MLPPCVKGEEIENGAIPLEMWYGSVACSMSLCRCRSVTFLRLSSCRCMSLSCSFRWVSAQ